MADEIVIYSSATCGWAIRNYAALYEKGVPFRVIDVKASAQAREAFARLFPYGLTPGLRHGETVVWDSLLINEYIDQAFPGVQLTPTDPIARARARQWVSHCDTVLFPALRSALYDRERLPELQAKLDHLSLPPFLVEAPGPLWGGAQLGLVDLAFHMLFASLRAPGLEDIERPAWMRAWADAIATAPSVVRAEAMLKSLQTSPVA